MWRPLPPVIAAPARTPAQVGYSQFVAFARLVPPIQGVPWIKKLPGAVVGLLTQVPPRVPPPPYHLQPTQILPIAGVPWNRFSPLPIIAMAFVPPSPPAPVGSSDWRPNQTPGVPVPGAPWQVSFGPFGRLPLTPSVPPKGTVPPPPPPQPGKVKSLPFVPRVPTLDSQQGRDQLRRFTEYVMNLLNSLVSAGLLQQTGPATWTINTSDLAVPQQTYQSLPAHPVPPTSGGTTYMIGSVLYFMDSEGNITQIAP